MTNSWRRLIKFHIMEDAAKPVFYTLDEYRLQQKPFKKIKKESWLYYILLIPCNRIVYIQAAMQEDIL